MKSKEIRQKWIDFFKSKKHLELPSQSLIPINDPSLLWINSGVATLKDYFSGKKIPPAQRLVNSQKAIRTNDIENVGITSRHHTFFEMLGNFSIGDYFKEEAIKYAYEFIFDVLKLEKDKVYITYFKDDKETKNYWIENGIAKDHLIAGTRETNFWDVGSGPCGPDTEIFYDRGDKYDKRGIELLKKDIENDRYIEIWNIVFSQFNNDGENNYSELNQKNIDTGAGLERIVAIMQNAPTNYDSDLFQGIIKEIEKFTTLKYDINNYFTKEKEQAEINTNFKIIADHIRAITNAIADGAKISNVGRGYIIRRLIRRAIYKGMQLNINDLFLYKLVKIVKSILPFQFNSKFVANEIKKEEILFHQTIEKGKKLLEENIDKKSKNFSGYTAFKLFETYGFPIELTVEILKTKNIDVNLKEFDQAKKEHIKASRGLKKEGMSKVINPLALIDKKIDNFIGYEELEGKTKILRMFDDQNFIKKCEDVCYLILENTPFYATSGGQNHDEGYLLQDGNEIEILDVFKDKFANHIHKVKGVVNLNKEVECYVDKEKRLNLARNHSATHLTFRALRETYGYEVEQKGSDITHERFTFDFPMNHKPTDEEVKQIEAYMLNVIKKDIKREYILTNIEGAKKMHAIMTIEEEEYMDPNNVRVVKWEDVTTDLCGGTHLEKSSILENFKITHVDKKGANIYRIRAVTSNKLVNKYLTDQINEYHETITNVYKKIQDLNDKYKLELKSKFENRNEELDYLKKQLKFLREKYKDELKNNSKIEFDFDNIKFNLINGKKVYVNLDVDTSSAKVLASTIRERFPNNYIFIGSKGEKDLLLVVACKKENANIIFQEIAKKINGRGGGSPILAMGKIKNMILKSEFFKILEEVL